jgi:hypothetical protein
MKRAISAWLHKFAETAEKALTAEFKHQGLKTDEAKAKFVQFLLGDSKDLSSKNHPFIWESIYDNPEADRQVIFLCSFMLAMLRITHREYFKVAWLHEHFWSMSWLSRTFPKNTVCRSSQLVCSSYLSRWYVSTASHDIHIL